MKVRFRRNRRWSDWTALSEDCYLLRTNLTDTDPATLWKRYIQLTEAEWAFRITKDELELRPIWHQREDRVLAHILVCFLAYVLRCVTEPDDAQKVLLHRLGIDLPRRLRNLEDPVPM